jgi:hypothetical protein
MGRGDRTAPALAPYDVSLLAARALTVVVIAGLAGASPAPAQDDPRYSADAPGAVHRFEIAADARQVLHTLWDSSEAAGAERVACIGGERTGGVALITRVLPLEASAADSMGVSASASIERCGPPDWFGTAHTHIAHRRGERPYTTFSGADRGVMRLWLRRWSADGVFCLLYSPSDAHCEAEGDSGSLIAGPETGASY